MANYIKPRSTLPLREKRLFNRLIKSFDPSFYNSGDACLMEEFVFCFFVVEDAKKVLRKEGMVVQGQKGTQVASPHSRILKDHIALMNSLASKLRLSAQQRLIRQNVGPSMRKAASNRVYDPAGAASNWRDHKNKDFDS